MAKPRSLFQKFFSTQESKETKLTTREIEAKKIYDNLTNCLSSVSKELEKVSKQAKVTAGTFGSR